MRMASESPAAAPVDFLVIRLSRSVAASLLSVGVLDRDLSVPEREHIAALDLNTNAIVPRTGKHPFGHTSVPRNEVLGSAPACIGELLEHRLDPFSDLALTVVDSAPDANTSRGFKHAVIGHSRHDPIHVMSVPGVGERVQKFESDLSGFPWHLQHLQRSG